MGSTESLSVRYTAYEVHFTCRTRNEVIKARALMALIPGSCTADDSDAFRGASRIGEWGFAWTALQSFNTLSSHNNTLTEYTVEKATLERVSFERIMFKKIMNVVIGLGGRYF